KSRLMTDEIGWSKAWMNANLIGLGGGHSVSVTWNPVVNVDGYNVYRAAVSGGPYTKIASVTKAAYTDYAVNPHQVWYYTETSVSGGHESAFFSETSATVPGNWVYIYPGSYEDTSTEAIAAAAGTAGLGEGEASQPERTARRVWPGAWTVQN